MSRAPLINSELLTSSLLWSVVNSLPSPIPEWKQSLAARLRPSGHSYGGKTASPRYCYSVWLRHLKNVLESGQPMPQTVAELGPGNSLGVGICALLSGAERYMGFDILPMADRERNLRLLDPLTALFQARAPIPDRSEFPEVKPYLDDYAFPHSLLEKSALDQALRPERVASIRKSLETLTDRVSYVAPWHDAATLREGTVDLIFSQAVLEHVEDLEFTYQTVARWLKPGGMLSSQIDFRCHGSARTWCGHWTFSDREWNFVRRRRLAGIINRQPLSTHLRHLRNAGFEIVHTKTVTQPQTLDRARLAPPFQHLQDDDLRTSGAYLLARKPL